MQGETNAEGISSSKNKQIDSWAYMLASWPFVPGEIFWINSKGYYLWACARMASENLAKSKYCASSHYAFFLVWLIY